MSTNVKYFCAAPLLLAEIALFFLSTNVARAQDIRVTEPVMRAQTEQAREVMRQLPKSGAQTEQTTEIQPASPRLRIDKTQQIPHTPTLPAAPKPELSLNPSSQSKIQAYNLQDDWTGKSNLSDDKQVYVFLSLSAPDSVIRYHLKKAQNIGATVVLRGFLGNNAAASSNVFLNKFAMPGLKIHIDPYKFKEWEITKVPSWVFVKRASCKPVNNLTDIKCESNQGIKITGDVDWSYITEKIQHHSNDFDIYFVDNHAIQ